MNDTKIIETNTIEKLGYAFDEATNKVVKSSEELSEKVVSTVKKYPLHTALAAGAAGLVAGAIISRK
jgi:ElaB/YqjD/DUF883 family membrane-anchored ribosome-binding protein